VRVGQYQEAIINFNKSLELQPDLLEAILNKADAFKELKNFDEGASMHRYRLLKLKILLLKYGPRKEISCII
jgi:tetratricopeptide (TPR) repeat protein